MSESILWTVLLLIEAILIFMIGNTLFRRVQIRLLELIFLVIMLGAVQGLTMNLFQWAWLVSWSGARYNVAQKFILLGALLMTWILGGSAWGLWIATRLHWVASSHRFLAMVFGLLVMAAFPGVGYAVYLFYEKQPVGASAIMVMCAPLLISGGTFNERAKVVRK